MAFGRPHGPLRVALGFLALGALGTLGVTITRLGSGLDGLERGNQGTLLGSSAIVEVNDAVAGRLLQLTALTTAADAALAETKGIAPLLIQLRDAIKPAAAQVAAGRAGGETSEQILREIERIVTELGSRASGLHTSAAAFGGQQDSLIAIVEALVADVEASLDDAKRINRSIPG